ncbi:hypothetical protein Leryth_014218 [Lithospermum erythrorhizon]|nr:hypothetical protein Leryth_014218 [Lithospermum erythrorhizon]
MADHSMVFGSSSNGATNMKIGSSYSSVNSPSLVMNGPPPFHGLRSMLSFKNTGSEKSFFCSFNQDENVDDDDLEEYLHQPEKKRRLTVEQVQFLEKSFDTDNKLEPERKMQLAKELDLQPRQIAIWFQNRRARWKNKNLEKDYDTLKSNYDNLKADYDSLLSEKEKLQAEVRRLTDKLPLNDNQKDLRNYGGEKLFQLLPKAPIAESVATSESSQAPVVALRQDDLSSSRSGVLDSDSSHFADGVHSSFLETGDSSYIFECEQSNLSLDEEDNFSKNLLSLANEDFKIHDPNYTSFPANPNFFGLPHDDHAFRSWPY